MINLLEINIYMSLHTDTKKSKPQSMKEAVEQLRTATTLNLFLKKLDKVVVIFRRATRRIDFLVNPDDDAGRCSRYRSIEYSIGYEPKKTFRALALHGDGCGEENDENDDDHDHDMARTNPRLSVEEDHKLKWYVDDDDDGGGRVIDSICLYVFNAPGHQTTVVISKDTFSREVQLREFAVFGRTGSVGTCILDDKCFRENPHIEKITLSCAVDRLELGDAVFEHCTKLRELVLYAAITATTTTATTATTAATTTAATTTAPSAVDLSMINGCRSLTRVLLLGGGFRRLVNLGDAISEESCPLLHSLTFREQSGQEDDDDAHHAHDAHDAHDAHHATDVDGRRSSNHIAQLHHMRRYIDELHAEHEKVTEACLRLHSREAGEGVKRNRNKKRKERTRRRIRRRIKRRDEKEKKKEHKNRPRQVKKTDKRRTPKRTIDDEPFSPKMGYGEDSLTFVWNYSIFVLFFR